MKIFIATAALIFCLIKPNNSEEVLQKMYSQYAGKWMHSFTFDQTTGMYRNDSLIKTV